MVSDGTVLLLLCERDKEADAITGVGGVMMVGVSGRDVPHISHSCRSPRFTYVHAGQFHGGAVVGSTTARPEDVRAV